MISPEPRWRHAARSVLRLGWITLLWLPAERLGVYLFGSRTANWILSDRWVLFRIALLAAWFCLMIGALFAWMGPLRRLGTVAVVLPHQIAAFLLAQPLIILVARRLGGGVDPMNMEFASRTWIGFHVWAWERTAPSYLVWGFPLVLCYTILFLRDRRRASTSER